MKQFAHNLHENCVFLEYTRKFAHNLHKNCVCFLKWNELVPWVILLKRKQHKKLHWNFPKKK